MKTSFYFSPRALITAGALLLIHGCTLTIPATIDMKDSGSSVNNMVVVEDLGVGYDYVYLDPEDMARNSVRNRGVRPRVFEFKEDPNPNHTIDIPVLGNQPPTRRNRVLGVDSETNPRFEWNDNARFIYSARDFQNAYQTTFSASGGAPVTAAFSASASYGQVKQNTSSQSNMYVYKDGIFRGHTMELDPYFQHPLTRSFKKAVAALDKSLQDPVAYKNFIHNWGTHYSRQVTIGAKCSYRENISKEFASSRYQDSQQFQAEMSARMGVYEASFGGGTDRSGGEGNESGTEKAEVKFISYGGSGAGTTSFQDWSEAAVVNSTLIDLQLESYLSLFNTRHFPNDTMIALKHDMLKAALEQYDQEQVAKIDTSFADTANFFRDEVIYFFVEARTFISKKSKEWEDNKNGDKWKSQYWGTLKLELVDKDRLSKADPVSIFDRKEDRGQKGWDPPKNDNGPLRLSPDDGGYELKVNKSYPVRASQVQDGLAISVTGQLKEMQNWGNQEFPALYKRDQANKNTVILSEVPNKESKDFSITLTSNTGDDEVEIRLYITKNAGPNSLQRP